MGALDANGWLNPFVYEAVSGQRHQRFHLSKIADLVLFDPDVMRELVNKSEHNYQDVTDIRKALPSKIRLCLKRYQRTIRREDNQGQPLFLRVYPSFRWYGDVCYRHLDGLTIEEYEAILETKEMNRRAVTRQEQFWSNATQIWRTNPYMAQQARFMRAMEALE